MHIVLSVVALFRLDTSLFPPSIVHLDTGYCSFMSVVLLRHRHTNPIWQSFVDTWSAISNTKDYTQEMRAERKASALRRQSFQSAESAKQATTQKANSEGGTEPALTGEQARVAREQRRASKVGMNWRMTASVKQRQVRSRWLLAYSLLNNPSLILERFQDGQENTEAPGSTGFVENDAGGPDFHLSDAAHAHAPPMTGAQAKEDMPRRRGSKTKVVPRNENSRRTHHVARRKSLVSSKHHHMDDAAKTAEAINAGARPVTEDEITTTVLVEELQVSHVSSKKKEPAQVEEPKSMAAAHAALLSEIDGF